MNTTKIWMSFKHLEGNHKKYVHDAVLSIFTLFDFYFNGFVFLLLGAILVHFFQSEKKEYKGSENPQRLYLKTILMQK
jgi:hypothetical protein